MIASHIKCKNVTWNFKEGYVTPSEFIHLTCPIVKIHATHLSFLNHPWVSACGRLLPIENPCIPICLRGSKPDLVPRILKLGQLFHRYLISREKRNQIA